MVILLFNLSNNSIHFLLHSTDSKFSLRLSSCGALKVMNPILTRLANKSQLGLYPILQVRYVTLHRIAA